MGPTNPLRLRGTQACRPSSVATAPGTSKSAASTEIKTTNSPWSTSRRNSRQHRLPTPLPCQQGTCCRSMRSRCPFQRPTLTESGIPPWPPRLLFFSPSTQATQCFRCQTVSQLNLLLKRMAAIASKMTIRAQTVSHQKLPANASKNDGGSFEKNRRSARGVEARGGTAGCSWPP